MQTVQVDEAGGRELRLTPGPPPDLSPPSEGLVLSSCLTQSQKGGAAGARDPSTALVGRVGPAARALPLWGSGPGGPGLEQLFFHGAGACQVGGRHGGCMCRGSRD